MLNEQKMSHWNRLMKFSIAADLFLAHLEMAVERKQCLKRFVEISSCSFAKRFWSEVGCSRGLHSAANTPY